MLAQVFFAAGAKVVHTPIAGFDVLDLAARSRRRCGARRSAPWDLDLSAYHPLGTARMGRDPATSVVDADHQLHDTPGLYVVDGAAVPSSLGVNPQITIMALATRAAEKIAAAARLTSQLSERAAITPRVVPRAWRRHAVVLCAEPMRHALAALLTVTLLPSVAFARADHRRRQPRARPEQARRRGRRRAEPRDRAVRPARVHRSPVRPARAAAGSPTDDTGVDVRKATALLVVDLGAHGRLVPTLLAGIGMDRAESTYGGTSEARHIEGGFGLEYRAAGGLTIGADVRMGGRTLHEPGYETQPVYDGGPGYRDCLDACGTGLTYAPSTLREGEYRTARITVGVRF